ncbi:MAG TPA: FAD-binding oxidoreductase [Patescibacteria group bacterium]|nr:FAD-binding oxidoreductase [Patescibacteria group bacterium]
MNKTAQYLQEHLVGEVMTSPDARQYFSTDGSIFELTPQIIIYPRVENDVRKTARFTWQLAERGRSISITARGSGTDQAGAALGNGIMLIFPAHMNKILSLNSRKGVVTIQPGINYGKLQQTLHTHGLFMPPFPASIEYSTVGGAIANNASGEKTIKYGATKNYVRELRVVLANGEVITTGRLNKRELNRKMGLATFEGEIYRTLDALLADNKSLIEKTIPKVTKNSAGYNIWDIKDKDGSVDLTPLFVGSQGTLGIVTEAKLEAESYNPKRTLLVGFFDDLNKAGLAVEKLRNLGPSALELVDEHLLNFIEKYNPHQLRNIIEQPFAKLVIFIEFDDLTKRAQAKRAKKAKKILKEFARDFKVTQDEHEQEDLWKIRHSAAAINWQDVGSKRALPFIEDGIVPPERLSELLQKVYDLFESYGLDVAVWGHAGDANLHLQPFMDLTSVGDRQKIFKLMDAYYQIIISLGGSITGEHSDGRLRAPYLEAQYGDDVYEVFVKIKQLFDPYGTLNVGVKFDVNIQDLQALMRHEFSMNHLYDHMPRT